MLKVMNESDQIKIINLAHFFPSKKQEPDQDQDKKQFIHRHQYKA